MSEERTKVEYVYTGFWDRYRLPVIIVALLISQTMGFFFILKYYDKLSANPCSMCAARHNEDIIFTIVGQNPQTGEFTSTSKIYYVNGSSKVYGSELFKVNFSGGTEE